MRNNFPDQKMLDWIPPNDWTKITTVDAYTEGEPLRIITSGFPPLQGDTILKKRQYAKENYDHLRTALMWEPRGHADMYGCIITPPVTNEADFGVLFLHNEGYSTMCGHGIIAVTKVVLETGSFPIESPLTSIKIDTPAGLVSAFARIENGKVSSVFFRNVPSFVLALDEEIDVQDIGRLRYDLAFGGAFYSFIKAADVGLTCNPENVGALIETGMAIKRAIMQSKDIQHPYEKDLNFLYGTILIDAPQSSDADSRNVCIFAEGEVDRSPTGTGVSARMAIHYARGEIGIGEAMVIESIIGSKFIASVKEVTRFGDYTAVIPEVEGKAYITGRHEFVIDPDDPFKGGFLLR